MGAHHYSYAIDVWSVGCIFAELLGRKILFQASSPLKQVRDNFHFLFICETSIKKPQKTNIIFFAHFLKF